jgi:hypothetical protein
MKKILAALAIIGLAGFIFSTTSRAATYQKRLIEQQKKIWHGFNNGQLTRHETRRLMHEQHKIRRYIRSLTRDGHLSAKERKRINRRLYKSDRHIWRLKHNSHYASRHSQPDRRHRYRSDRHRWHIWKQPGPK